MRWTTFARCGSQAVRDLKDTPGFCDASVARMVFDMALTAPLYSAPAPEALMIGVHLARSAAISFANSAGCI
jgi:hypothetical protein